MNAVVCTAVVPLFDKVSHIKLQAPADLITLLKSLYTQYLLGILLTGFFTTGLVRPSLKTRGTRLWKVL